MRFHVDKSYFSSASRRSGILVISATLIASILAGSAAVAEEPEAPDSSAPATSATPTDSDDDGTLDAPDTASAFAGAAAEKKPVEDLSRRTESSTTVVNPNGSFTLRDYQGPVRVKVDGRWADVDQTLVKQDDGNYRPKVSATDIVIGGGGNNEAGQVTLEDGHTVAITWPETLPDPTIDGNVATYKVSDAADLLMIAGGQGVAAHLRLNERPAEDDPVFTFGLRTDDLTVTETPGGGLAMNDDKGRTLAATSQLVAWDAKTDEAGAPRETVALDASLDQSARKGDVNTHDLNLKAPDGYLDNPETQYPVIIDPNVVALDANSDTFVRLDDGVDHGADFDLRVGKTTTTGNVNPAITYMKWNLNQVPGGAQVLSAELGLHQWWAGSCGAPTMVGQPLGSNWAPSVLYPQRPSSLPRDYEYTTDNKGYQCGNPGRITMPASTWVNYWVAHRDTGGQVGYENFGIRLGVPDASEGQSSYGRRLCSYQYGVDANCPNSTFQPYLSVTYNTAPATPTNVEVTRGGNPATVYATLNDYNGESNLRAQLKVTRSGGVVWQGETPPTAGNQNAQASGRLPYLPDGQYEVTATAVDDWGLTSAPSAARTFTIDTELGSQSWFSTTAHSLNDRSGILVNNRTGGLAVQAGDISVNGLGLDLNATRFYNSQANQAAAQGTGIGWPTAMGKGWGLTIGPDVWMRRTGFEVGGSYSYTYYGPGGTNFGTFVPKGSIFLPSNDFTKPSGGVGADLSKSGSGTSTIFTLKFRKSQLRYEFKPYGTSSHLYQTKIRDRSGNEINFAYSGTTPNGRARLTQIVDSSSRVYGVTYTGNNITSIAETGVTNPRTWSYGYDTTNNTMTSYTVSQSGSPSQVTNYTYQPSTATTVPLLTKIEDPAVAGGARTTTDVEYYGTDANADRVKTVRYKRDASNSDDFTWTYNRRNAAQACDNGGDDGSKYSTKVTDARGEDTAYCFRDASGSDKTRIRVKDADGNTKTTSYTADKGTDAVSTPSGEGVSDGSTVAKYGTGALTDQLTEVTEPKTANDGAVDKAKTTFSYSHSSGGSATPAGGNYLPGTVKRSNGNCSAYEYDSEGRTTASYIGLAATDCSKPSKSGFHRKYNGNGTVSQSWDANAWRPNDSGTEPDNSNKTLYTYWSSSDAGYVANSSGQLKAIRKPGGSCDAPRKLCTSYTYDDRGRVATVTDGRGKVTTYTSDMMDRTTGTFFNGATACNGTNSNCVTYTYDAEGNLKTRTDSAGTSTFTYDLMNRQTQQAVPGSTVNLGYDGNGNLTSHTLIGSPDQTTSYTYSDANQLIKVKNDGLGAGASGEIGISSNKDGQVKEIRFPTANQLEANYDFKQSGKPKTADVKTNSGTLRDYTYDYVINKIGEVTIPGVEVGQLQSKTVEINGSNPSTRTTDYTYNKERLEGSEVDGLPDYFYTHDEVGNVTSEASAGTATYFGYDRAGQLCWRGQTDSSADKLKDTCSSGPSGSTEFTQDAAGNNANTPTNPTVYNDDSQVATIAGINMGYLDRGNNLRRAAGSTTYVNSPLGVVSRTNGTGTTYYVRDPRGTILASYGAGGTLFYFSEFNGSVAALYNTSGTEVGSYTYSPYGKTDASGTAAENSPFRYVGGVQDVDSPGNSSVYKLGARYYDSQGHFSQPDAVAGTITNPKTLTSYNYAGGDPINSSDPSGYSILDRVGEFTNLKDGYDAFQAFKSGDINEGFAITAGALAGNGFSGACTALTAAETAGFSAIPCFASGEIIGGRVEAAVDDDREWWMN